MIALRVGGIRINSIGQFQISFQSSVLNTFMSGGTQINSIGVEGLENSQSTVLDTSTFGGIRLSLTDSLLDIWKSIAKNTNMSGESNLS